MTPKQNHLDQRKISRPLVIAHRGARSVAPENSLAAADAARKMGANLWETDVNVTADGELILFHDDTLDRTTDVGSVFPNSKSPHRLDRYTLADLKRLDLGKPFIKKDPFGQITAGGCPTVSDLAGERIPTLKETLLYTAAHAWPVNLELKQQKGGSLRDFPLPEKVMKSIRELKVDPKLIIISSFNHEWLSRVAEEMPDIEIQALVGDDDEWEKGAIEWGTYRFETYNVNSEMVTVQDIETLKTMGKRINLFTVNDVQKMKGFMAAGVDGIITDFPQRLIVLLNENH